MRRRAAGVAIAALVAVVAAGCSLLPGSATGHEIDGIPIGPSRSCTELGLSATRCTLLVAVARDRLDRASPGHAEVVRAELFARSEPAGDVAPALAIDTRFSLGVVLLSLADGSRHAVEVICNPGRGAIEPVCQPD